MNATPAGLAVDAHSQSTNSNLNLLLEPGETVVVEPAWNNDGSTSAALAGTASSFTGPAGATYSAIDTSADYGQVASKAQADCQSATGNCYVFSVSDPATRPKAHWDATFVETLSPTISKTWTLHVGRTFSDVQTTSGSYLSIEALVHHEVTVGCGGGNFCPSNSVSRSELALFLARVMAGGDGAVPNSGVTPLGGFNCQAGGSSAFADVSPQDVFCKHVHYLAAHGVTEGCGAGNYCPTTNASRGQAAVFVARAMLGGDANVPTTYTDTDSNRSYSCDTTAPKLHFSDVTAADSYCRHAHYLWAREITAGCGADTYCPSVDATREQFAVFLARGFELSIYGP